MKNILIYDEDSKVDLDFFCKYKNLTLIKPEEFKEYAKDNWKEIEVIMDGTTKKSIYKAMAKDNKSSIYYKEIPYVFFKGKKAIALYDLKIYNYCKNSENFDETTLNKFVKQLEVVESVLDLTCTSYIDFLEKELDEFESNAVININSIVNKSDSDYYFVADKRNMITPNEKTIDFHSMMLLRELKDIFMHQI